MKLTRTLIIAEAGVNHNGDIEIAYQLIDKAKEAGADIVKFQTFKADKIASAKAIKAQYQNTTTDENESQLEMLRKLEIDEQMHLDLMAYCSKKNIQFLSTPFDLESINLLKKLRIAIGKIPSGEITNYPYLCKMAQSFSELIVSTGMSTMKEINEALKVLIDSGAQKENITILHCNTEYPTPFEDVNLRAMLYIRSQTGCAIGYSDHTNGIEVPIAAVALGATVIEKHFTLDKTMQGPDHKASLEPGELKAMVLAIRNIEIAIAGSGIKEPSGSEIKNKEIARKSIVANTKITKGEIFNENNITVKRPGTGINPMEWNNIIGEKAVCDFEMDDLIKFK